MERLPLLPLPTRKLEDDTPSPVQLPPLEAGTDAGAGASKSASPASVRQLTVTEINNFVRPEFESRGNALPDLSQAAFFGVMRDGRLTGSFITLQLRLHADPVLLVECGEAAHCQHSRRGGRVRVHSAGEYRAAGAIIRHAGRTVDGV